MRLWLDSFPSPLGTILLVSDDQYLRALDFVDDRERMLRLLRLHYGTVTLLPASDPVGAQSSLHAYFSGELNAIEDIPVATGGTSFQKEVWQALREIPAGTTTSYGALAARIGRAKASRAVGLANGSNPVGVVVPCHRVIGASGSLTGYGGGLERKHWLLAHEAAHAKSAL
jgi:O-6-methylguanine DNA methyltransferase